MDNCSPWSAYFMCVRVWNICTHRQSCHSLSCEQPAASHYAKSNKTVGLSLVSQSNISKYTLTTHIGEDLEVWLCVDIEDNVWGNYRHETPRLEREESKQLSTSQIHQIWGSSRQCFYVISSEDAHLCMWEGFEHKIFTSTLQCLTWSHKAAVSQAHKAVDFYKTNNLLICI